jgi:hypothetical protein
MVQIFGMLIGFVIATFGFLVMRNPMRLSLLAPGAEGYYQRLVLDTSIRNQLRVFGTLICLFGTSILMASAGALFKAHVLDAISEGLWELMGLMFLVCWCGGIVLAIWQVSRGRSFNWFQMWRVSAQLGPVNMFPPVTPEMQKEAILFTVGFVSLVCIAALAAIIRLT